MKSMLECLPDAYNNCTGRTSTYLRANYELTMALQVMGINVQPLLAVGGVSGIAIGFGAQSVSANAITGINLVSLALPGFSLSRVAAAHKAQCVGPLY